MKLDNKDVEIRILQEKNEEVKKNFESEFIRYKDLFETEAKTVTYKKVDLERTNNELKSELMYYKNLTKQKTTKSDRFQNKPKKSYYKSIPSFQSQQKKKIEAQQVHTLETSNNKKSESSDTENPLSSDRMDTKESKNYRDKDDGSPPAPISLELNSNLGKMRDAQPDDLSCTSKDITKLKKDLTTEFDDTS